MHVNRLLNTLLIKTTDTCNYDFLSVDTTHLIHKVKKHYSKNSTGGGDCLGHFNNGKYNQ